jgi:hypothetical protein
MDAPLVIADMSMHNANAFYELAIRHMVGLPTIHMIRNDWKIPFDVAPYRAIPFSWTDHADLEAAQEALKSTVEEVIKPGFEVENPITHARGVVKVREHASDAMRVVLDEMEGLKKKLNRTEVAAYLALQNANAAIGRMPSSPLEKLMSVPFNPASPPPMIFTSSDMPNTGRMGEIFGLAPSSSNSILGKLLDTEPKKEDGET